MGHGCAGRVSDAGHRRVRQQPQRGFVQHQPDEFGFGDQFGGIS